MSSTNGSAPTLALRDSLGPNERFVFLVEYIKGLETSLMCQQEQHEKQLKELRENFEAQMKVLEEKVRSHSVILHEELTRQAEKKESILRIQCFWRRKMAVRERIKLERAISEKVVAEAARVAIQANQNALKFVGIAVADVAAACARATAQKKWCATMSASWSSRVHDPSNTGSESSSDDGF